VAIFAFEKNREAGRTRPIGPIPGPGASKPALSRPPEARKIVAKIRAISPPMAIERRRSAGPSWIDRPWCGIIPGTPRTSPAPIRGETMIPEKARLRLLSLATLALALAGPPASGGEGPPDKVFVGYLYGPPRNLNFKLYTHLCHAFVTSDGEGNLATSRNVPDRNLTAEAHKSGVKVLVSLGGWGFDAQFASIVAKPEAEDRYAGAVLAMVDEADYDGIDLDWEYPDTKEEVAGFERLARRLRAGIDAIGKRKGRPMVLTMAASSNPGTLKWLGKEFLLATMDWINVMTYDYAGDWTDYAGHHSPLYASSKPPKGRGPSTEATMKYLLEERGLPADRLAVGIPLYGRGFAVGEPYAPTKGVPRSRMPNGDYANLQKLRLEQGWTRTWDDETKNPWLVSPGKDRVIGFDDAESVALKAAWARGRGFRGVFFWQVNGDRLPDGTNPLQEATHKALFEGPAKSGH
jgi:chitinase